MQTEAHEAPSARGTASFFVLATNPAGLVTLADGPALALFAERDLVGRRLAPILAPFPQLAAAADQARQGRPRILQLTTDTGGFEVHCQPQFERGAALLLGIQTSRIQEIEAERRKRERGLRQLFRQIPGAIWTTDSRLRITLVIGRLQDDPRFTEESLTGGTIFDFIDRRDPADPAVLGHQRALAGKHASLSYELRGRWYELSLDPLRDPEGRIVGCIGCGIDVTWQRQLEEELLRSRALLAEAQQAAHVGSWEVDVAQDFFTCSEETYRIYDVPPGSASGSWEPFRQRIHPDDLEATEAAAREAYRRGGAFSYQHRIVRPDGTCRMVWTRGRVMRERHQDRMVGSCWDITEHWHAMQKLERSLSLLRATFEATDDGLLVVDGAGQITTFNQQFLRLWRIPEALAERRDEDAILVHALDQLHDPEAFLERVRELHAHPDRNGVDEIRFLDGRVYERSSRPQRLEDAIIGRVWSFRDVSERHRLLHQALFLADASRLLASLDFEPALEGVARLSLSVLGDGCAVDLFEETSGPRRLVTVARDLSQAALPSLPRSVLAGNASLFSARQRSCMAVPLASRGHLLGALLFVAGPKRRFGRDDLALAEELGRRAALTIENARLYHQAEAALHSREEFLAIAAHELRTPLTSLHLGVQLLNQESLHPEAFHKVLERIAREDRKLAHLINELLDVARIRGGRLRLELTTVDLVTVTREVVASLSDELARSGSALSLNTAPRVVGIWDRSRMEQVVTNLLSNAIKFGMGRPIEITLTVQETTARLGVQDHGIGISPEIQEKIFLPFERAVSDRQYGGLGLGLYIVKTIVDALGGTITLNSRPGSGTCFLVELPCEKEG